MFLRPEGILQAGRHYVRDQSAKCLLIPSGKGKHPLLMYRNYTYTYKVLSASGVLWHCSRRTRTGCKAFIKSHPDHIDRIQAVFDEHCHHPRLTPSRSKKALAEKLT
ncbi:jg8413 [Pararge aegeria aegeria]|uniref:Jg8413 protein n=1 Tax=Pararge aegeria aegeria TaxID=348720 RepID=A0A8S4SNV5_9NEOP|nr:jg8413 [Pararge aegeria aegeria]